MYIGINSWENNIYVLVFISYRLSESIAFCLLICIDSYKSLSGSVFVELLDMWFVFRVYI